MQKETLEQVIAEINRCEARVAKFRKMRDNVWYGLMCLALISIILFLFGVIPL